MAQQTQEQDINHLLKVRREKLAELQQNGRDPFQITKFDQTHHSLEVKGLYEAHETELLKDRQEPNEREWMRSRRKKLLKRITKREEISWTQTRSMWQLQDV